MTVDANMDGLSPMPSIIEITGTITSANGSGSSTLASPSQAFSATISTSDSGSDLDASSGRGFFNLQNVTITLQLSGGTISTTQGSFEVKDAVSGSDQLILAAITPFSSVTGGTIGSLYFDFRSPNASLFFGDQQPLTMLGSSGFTLVRNLELTANSGAWTYQGEISSATVTAIPEPGFAALALGMVAAVVACRKSWRRG